MRKMAYFSQKSYLSFKNSPQENAQGKVLKLMAKRLSKYQKN
jgi:hypothetical protein